MNVSEMIYFLAEFTAVHFVAYVLAGIIVYPLSGDIYTGPDRVLTFMRDMSLDVENRRWMRLVLPTQVIRGILMAAVLVPIWEPIATLSFPLRAAFLFGLLFVYSDLSSGTPFANNIEGIIFLRDEFVSPRVFLKIQAEATIYCILFAVPAAWFLF